MSNLAPPNPSTSGREPSPEPETTAARDFSSELDAHFGLSNELTGLSQVVEDKRQTISTQTRELQELEARLRAAESKLQKVEEVAPTTRTSHSAQTNANSKMAAASAAEAAAQGPKQSSVSESAKAQAAAEAAKGATAGRS